MNATPENVIVEPQTGPTVCAVHPNVETTLRCNKCGRYMCARCSVLTPVGYRCKECVHQQQDVYFTATQTDYLVAAAVAFVLSVPVSYVIPRLFLFGVIILSVPAGGLIGELVFRAVRKRRGRYLWAVAAAGTIAGALMAFFPIIQQLTDPRVLAAGAVGLLSPLLYLVLCLAGVIGRLRYGK